MSASTHAFIYVPSIYPMQGAVDEQAGYGDDVTQMTQMISEAQLKLNAMPAPGSTTSLETLQHQLAEHRVSVG